MASNSNNIANNALVPYATPSRSPSKQGKKGKAIKNERKDPTLWDDALTKLFLHHRLVLRDACFKGKSAPNYGLGKVLEKMKKEDPDLVEKRNVTIPALKNRWSKLLSTVKSYQDSQNQTGACAMEPPQYYETMLDCLGADGRVAVDGAPFARDSGRGTTRVGYKDGEDDDADDVDMEGDCQLVQVSFTSEKQNGNSEKDDGESSKSQKTPMKRLSRRERQAQRAAENSSANALAICQAIENSAKLLNEGANARNQLLQETLRESEEKRMKEVKNQYDLLKMVFGKADKDATP